MWFEIGEAIKAIAAATTATAAVVGACIAIRGLNKWQTEIIGRRRTELAEDVLAGFYQARDVIRSIRSPIGYAGESSTRPAPENESEHIKRDRDVAYVPVARYEKHRALFGELLAKRYRMRAIFGSAANAPFNEIESCLTEILVAADSLMGMAGEQHRENEQSQQFRRECEEVIRRVRADDELAKRVDAAVHQMEKLCQPLLEGKRVIKSGLPTGT